MNRNINKRIEFRGGKRRERKSLKTRNPYRPFLFLFLFGILVLGITGGRMTIVEMTIELGELEKERKEIDTEVKRLELEISHLSSQKRIETLAREYLGMQYPAPTDVSPLRMNKR